MISLTCGTDELIYKTEIDSQMQRQTYGCRAGKGVGTWD